MGNECCGDKRKVDFDEDKVGFFFLELTGKKDPVKKKVFKAAILKKKKLISQYNVTISEDLYDVNEKDTLSKKEFVEWARKKYEPPVPKKAPKDKKKSPNLNL